MRTVSEIVSSGLIYIIKKKWKEWETHSEVKGHMNFYHICL